MATDRFIHSTADRLLIAAAVIGLLVYFFLLPKEHPDAAGEMELNADEAVQSAARFLTDHGYPVADLRPQVNLLRNQQSIRSLQDSLGRRWMLNELPGDAIESMGLFRWAVSFYKKTEEAGWSAVYTVNITPKGRVYEFANHDNNVTESPDVSVAELLRSSPDFAGALASIEDSLRSQSVEFDFNAFTGVIDSSMLGDLVRIERDTGSGLQKIVVEPGGVVQIARRHLRELGYNEALTADSLWLDYNGERSTAIVRFFDAASGFRQTPNIYVEIAPSGALYAIDTRVIGGSDDEGEGVTRDEIVTLGFAVIPSLGVVFFLLITFFRRLIARLIDVKAALVDGLIVSIMCVIFLIIQPNLVFGMSPLPLWARWVIPFAIGGFVGGGVAVLTFILASAADSFARSKLSSALASIGLIKRGQIFNGLVGRSLVRGVLAGVALLGLSTILLWMMPDAGIDVAAETTLQGGSLAVVMETIKAALLSYTLIGILLLTVLALLSRWTSNQRVLIGAGAVFLMSLQVVLPHVFPVGLALLGSVVTGLLLSWLFVRYDLLTSFTALFAATLIWSLQSGWLITGASTLIHFLVGALLIAGLLVFGIIGITRGDPLERIRDYVPAYIQELRSQERLRHELNIAQQVQGSFLPKKMPAMDGLDLAARCLVAEEVGGDYYDFVPLGDHKLAVVIGDVSGKGIQAAFFMTLVKGFVRTLCKEDLGPAEVLARVNELFCENAPRGMFISMVFGVVDIRASTFEFARAGHNPILVREADGQRVAAFQPSGIGIGFVKGRQFEKSVEQVSVSLRHGDAVVLYTDGFSEAMNHSRELFGDDRLSSVIRRAEALSADHLLNEVQEAVDNFVEGAERHDDMTMIVLKLDREQKQNGAYAQQKSL